MRPCGVPPRRWWLPWSNFRSTARHPRGWWSAASPSSPAQAPQRKDCFRPLFDPLRLHCRALQPPHPTRHSVCTCKPVCIKVLLYLALLGGRRVVVAHVVVGRLHVVLDCLVVASLLLVDLQHDTPAHKGMWYLKICAGETLTQHGLMLGGQSRQYCPTHVCDLLVDLADLFELAQLRQVAHSLAKGGDGVIRVDLHTVRDRGRRSYMVRD